MFAYVDNRVCLGWSRIHREIAIAVSTIAAATKGVHKAHYFICSMMKLVRLSTRLTLYFVTSIMVCILNTPIMPTINSIS